MNYIRHWISLFMDTSGLSATLSSWLVQLMALTVLFVFAYLLYVISRYILVNVVHRVLTSKRFGLESYFTNPRVLKSFCKLLPPIVIYTLLPLVVLQETLLSDFLFKSCSIYFIVVAIRFINLFIEVVFKISSRHSHLRNRPLKGVYQILQVILIFLGVILVISVLFNKSPLNLLAGLGASAAILMLVFKDTIIGLVSGIQLAANDMLRPGDWIVMSKHDIDGEVVDVTLNTVKVRNWDNTTVTVPPYQLISDSFQNWRGMSESEGRRIKRAIHIDVTSIHFCTPELLDRLSEIPYLREYIELHRHEALTNIGLFRVYLESYISALPETNHQLSHLVRQLAPTPQGLPLEVYFFSRDKVWKSYENLQSALFDHIFATISQFELTPYQAPSAYDVQGLNRV